ELERYGDFNFKIEATPMTILVFIKDMVLKSKITEYSSSRGISISYQSNWENFKEVLNSASVSKIILDINLLGDDNLAGKLSWILENAPKVEIIGFCSHINKELFEIAQETGLKTVLPRSKFFTNLETWIN
ncbi:MAG: hypothetical protein SGJ02_00755, partial [bacterium]|nr:hypothetical protein [bacterium]